MLLPGELPQGVLAFGAEARKQTKGMTDDDREKLLQIANEREWTKPRLPETSPDLLELFQRGLKRRLAYGTGLNGQIEVFREIGRDAVGAPHDTRDADTLAREFLTRAHGLAHLRGDEQPDAVLAQAREDVLDGVPMGYRRKVLEKILDREENALRENTTGSEDMRAMVEARDKRREHGWRVLTGRAEGGKGGRG